DVSEADGPYVVGPVGFSQLTSTDAVSASNAMRFMMPSFLTRCFMVALSREVPRCRQPSGRGAGCLSGKLAAWCAGTSCRRLWEEPRRRGARYSTLRRPVWSAKRINWERCFTPSFTMMRARYVSTVFELNTGLLKVE